MRARRCPAAARGRGRRRPRRRPNGRLDATFVLGEAASIPLQDSSADVVLSVFGAVFAPDPRAAADEMARILAADGRMLLAAWIPGGAISRAVRLTRETVAETLGEPARPAVRVA